MEFSQLQRCMAGWDRGVEWVEPALKLGAKVATLDGNMEIDWYITKGAILKADFCRLHVGFAAKLWVPSTNEFVCQS